MLFDWWLAVDHVDLRWRSWRSASVDLIEPSVPGFATICLHQSGSKGSCLEGLEMFRSRREGIDLVCQVARSGPDNVVPVYRRVKHFGRSVAGQVARMKGIDDGNRFLPSLIFDAALLPRSRGS